MYDVLWRDGQMGNIFWCSGAMLGYAVLECDTSSFPIFCETIPISLQLPC